MRANKLRPVWLVLLALSVASCAHWQPDGEFRRRPPSALSLKPMFASMSPVERIVHIRGRVFCVAVAGVRGTPRGWVTTLKKDGENNNVDIESNSADEIDEGTVPRPKISIDYYRRGQWSDCAGATFDVETLDLMLGDGGYCYRFHANLSGSGWKLLERRTLFETVVPREFDSETGRLKLVRSPTKVPCGTTLYAYPRH